jgi:uncharacterized protein (TIGR03067 family)
VSQPSKTAPPYRVVYSERCRDRTRELQPGKTPKEIDLIALDGTYKGAKQLGIYKLEKDSLILVLPGNIKKKDRPKTFEAPEDSYLNLITLKKIPAK